MADIAKLTAWINPGRIGPLSAAKRAVELKLLTPQASIYSGSHQMQEMLNQLSKDIIPKIDMKLIHN